MEIGRRSFLRTVGALAIGASVPTSLIANDDDKFTAAIEKYLKDNVTINEDLTPGNIVVDNRTTLAIRVDPKKGDGGTVFLFVQSKDVRNNEKVQVAEIPADKITKAMNGETWKVPVAPGDNFEKYPENIKNPKLYILGSNEASALRSAGGQKFYVSSKKSAALLLKFVKELSLKDKKSFDPRIFEDKFKVELSQAL